MGTRSVETVYCDFSKRPEDPGIYTLSKIKNQISQKISNLFFKLIKLLKNIKNILFVIKLIPNQNEI
jgi:hypothetical protein